MAAPAFVLSLREGAVLSERDGGLVLETAERRFVFPRLAAALRAALRDLAGPGVEERLLRERAMATGGTEGLAALSYCLERLDRGGVLVRSDGALVSLVPTAPGFRLPASGPDPSRRYVLSRFAHARRLGSRLVLESPLSGARIVLGGPRAAVLLTALAEPGRPAELLDRARDLSDGGLALLHGAGMLSEADGDEPAGGWELADLLLHASSRMGGHDRPLGAVYPFGDEAPPPAVETPAAATWVPLARADPGRADMPVGEALAAPRARRDYAPEPIAVRELGELLHRTARIRGRATVDVDTPHGPAALELTSRPYPSGGSLYELELYPAVARCAGLAPGLYRYDALAHRLGALPAPAATVERLLDEAARRAEIPRDELQVLLLVAARFGRRAWKYASTAYSNTLKDVGVLYEAMSCVATAMGLAPWAVGAADPGLLAAATGADPYAEGAVGGLLLGAGASSRRR